MLRALSSGACRLGRTFGNHLAPFALSAQRFSTQDAAPGLHVCIVGSGPAGFYMADRLLYRFGENTRVTVLERLPMPFGLVRYGVAPDHPDTKAVINKFTGFVRAGRVDLLCNTAVGADVSVAELRQLFHVLVIATGAEGDRKLGIPGEDLSGVSSARDFVNWYNGHPDASGFQFDLSKIEDVAIFGQGNVAVDIARVLLRPAEDLAKTDMAAHAVEQLRRSAVRRVSVIGRRGPAQAQFTPKELRELLSLPGVRVVIPEDELSLAPEDEAEAALNRVRRRAFDELKKAAAAAASAAPAALAPQRELHLRFRRSPVEVLPAGPGPGPGAGAGAGAAAGRREAAAVRLEENALSGPAGNRKAKGTGRAENLRAQLVLRSIGYRGQPVKGLPFDDARAVIPNVMGRVQGVEGAGAGVYCNGWIKRGPSGIIGSNLVDAEETVAMVEEDVKGGAVPAGEPRAGAQGLRRLLRDRKVPVVDAEGWLRIEAAEKAAGEAAGKPREKVVSLSRALALASGEV